MDAKMIATHHHTCFFIATAGSRHKNRYSNNTKNNSPLVLAVTSSREPPPPPQAPAKVRESAPPSTSYSQNSKSVYHDNWFDQIAIHHLSHSLQNTAGMRSRKNGYDGLVEAAGEVYRKFDPGQQLQVVIRTLEKAFPQPILSLIRLLLPQSKFAREYYAVFTTMFFAWLVGQCEVRESEFEGRKEKNVVHIKKCRLLEGTNCVGICTNLCKLPSQLFIKESLGMPLNMVPNFEDMSCDMIFGQEPPLPFNDPALSQPCYKLCQEKKRNHSSCISQ